MNKRQFAGSPAYKRLRKRTLNRAGFAWPVGLKCGVPGGRCPVGCRKELAVAQAGEELEVEPYGV